ncbi:hypothetical protein ACHAW6_001636 [Cyclotella cf. meneghiniana]
MDALDPVDFDNFADRRYNNTPFIQSLYNDLSPDGVLVVQLSVSPNAVNPSVKNRPFKHQANMISKLQHLGFQSIHIGDSDTAPLSNVCHPIRPAGVVAFRCRHNARISDTAQIVREHPEERKEYNGFQTDGAQHLPTMPVRIQKSGVSESAGWGLFAMEDIPLSATITLEKVTQEFHVVPSTWRVLDSVYEWSNERAVLWDQE